LVLIYITTEKNFPTEISLKKNFNYPGFEHFFCFFFWVREIEISTGASHPFLMTDGLVGNSDMTKLIFSTGGIASWTFFPVKPLTDTSAGIGVFDVSDGRMDVFHGIWGKSHGTSIRQIP
jgi:hypothetical protein